MKIFKAILYSLLLLVWIILTIAATVTFVPIVIICGFFPNEWFDLKDVFIDELQNL